MKNNDEEDINKLWKKQLEELKGNSNGNQNNNNEKEDKEENDFNFDMNMGNMGMSLGDLSNEQQIPDFLKKLLMEKLKSSMGKDEKKDGSHSKTPGKKKNQNS